MAVQLIEDQEVWLAGFNFQTQMNSIAESMTTAQLDATVLGGDTRIFEPGLKGYGLNGEGFWEGGNLGMDKTLIDRFRTQNVPCSLALTDGTTGSPARTLQAMVAGYQIQGNVGELLKVTFDVGAMGTPVRGTVMHNASATGNVTGTAYQLGSVSATQSMYAALHVFSGSGNFIVVVESDDNSGMTSPTTRGTFATVLTGTAQASEWLTPVAGSITDDWWRITATNPATRDFAVVVGIR